MWVLRCGMWWLGSWVDRCGWFRGVLCEGWGLVWWLGVGCVHGRVSGLGWR